MEKDLLENRALTSDPDDLVILVHGTFAGDESDEGTRWWQRGSDTWVSLQELLPADVTLQDVFHWDRGSNSARARLSGALDLLEKLKELENHRQGYHLVGHSHGGSVIWECLQQAVLQRSNRRVKNDMKKVLQLHYLRSWATVGTPFLSFSPAPNLFGPPGFLRKSRIIGWLIRWYNRIEPRMVRKTPQFLDRLGSVTMLFLIAFFVLMSVIVWTILGQELNSPVTLWFLTGVPAVFLVFLLSGAYEHQVERFQLIRDRHVCHKAAKEYGDKWFGIFSPEDEAIAGLKATVDLRLNIVPHRTLDKQVFHSDRIYGWLRPLRLAMYQFYNLVVPSVANRYISYQLARNSQGNDRPGTIVQQVSAGPIPGERHYLSLPTSINGDLVEHANEHAKQLVPELRRMLGSLASSGVYANQNEKLAIDLTAGLVHNAYFFNDDVLKLIAWNIATSSHGQALEHQLELRNELIKWAQEFKANVKANLVNVTQGS